MTTLNEAFAAVAKKLKLRAERLQEVIDRCKEYEPHTGRWSLEMVQEMELTDAEVSAITAEEPWLFMKRLKVDEVTQRMASAAEQGPASLGACVISIMKVAAEDEMVAQLNAAAEAARMMDEDVRASNHSYDDPGEPRERFAPRDDWDTM